MLSSAKFLPQLLKRTPNYTVKQLSSKCVNKITEESTYSPVYSFPHITSLAIVNKAKVYQTVASFVAIPVSYAMSIAEVCSIDVCLGITTFGVSGCFLLHTLGYLTSNTVGVIYLNKEETKSKISYLDTWGSRRDIEIDLKDIVPFSEQPASITDPLYLNLRQYTSKDKLKMNVRYGVVLNPSKFQVIFHKVS